MLRERGWAGGRADGRTDARSKIARVIANCAILLNKLNDLTTCARTRARARALAAHAAAIISIWPRESACILMTGINSTRAVEVAISRGSCAQRSPVAT